MHSDATNLVDTFYLAFSTNTGAFMLKSSVNVAWNTPVGYLTYGNPVVAEGRVLLGTSTYGTKKYTGDRGVLICLNESNGALMWQANVPRSASGGYLSEYCLGLCSSPTVEYGRAYVTGYNAEVICYDMMGLSNGNDGPFTNEEQFYAGTNKIKLDAQDGDIIWRFDLFKAFGIMPHDGYGSNPLIVGDHIFINTGAGITRRHRDRSPYTNGPALIVLNKKNGELVARDFENIPTNTVHGNWCSPSLAIVHGKKQILFGGGDGVCYSFDPSPAHTNTTPKCGMLKKIWSVDLNAIRGTNMRPSDVIATPVCFDNKAYAVLGEDWTHANRRGLLVCIDAMKTGDLTKTGIIWAYTNITLSVSTPAIADGLLYVSDQGGLVHCLDAATGTLQWTYNTGAPIWQSAIIADGKVFIGNSRGKFFIFKHDRKVKLMAEVNMKREMAGSPVVSGDTLYVATYGMMYAIRKAGK